MKIPFEINLLSFNSPDEAFHYINYNKSISKIYFSDKCAFIFSDDDLESSPYNFTYVNKKNGKWHYKSPLFVSMPITSFSIKLEQTFYIKTISNKECNEKLIIIETLSLPNNDPNNIEIKDNIGSDFIYYQMTSHFYYKIVDANIDKYQILINGKIVEIDD